MPDDELHAVLCRNAGKHTDPLTVAVTLRLGSEAVKSTPHEKYLPELVYVDCSTRITAQGPIIDACYDVVTSYLSGRWLRGPFSDRSSPYQ